MVTYLTANLQAPNVRLKHIFSKFRNIDCSKMFPPNSPKKRMMQAGAEAE